MKNTYGLISLAESFEKKGYDVHNTDVWTKDNKNPSTDHMSKKEIINSLSKQVSSLSRDIAELFAATKPMISFLDVNYMETKKELGQAKTILEKTLSGLRQV